MAFWVGGFANIKVHKLGGPPEKLWGGFFCSELSGDCFFARPLRKYLKKSYLKTPNKQRSPKPQFVSLWRQTTVGQLVFNSWCFCTISMNQKLLLTIPTPQRLSCASPPTELLTFVSMKEEIDFVVTWWRGRRMDFPCDLRAPYDLAALFCPIPSGNNQDYPSKAAN